MGYRDYSTGKGLIVDATGHGDFTTLEAALAVATSGQTIFLRPGTYTPAGGTFNYTAGVTVTCFAGDGYNGNVTIVGKGVVSGAGTFTIANVRLQTNSDFCLVVSGSVANTTNLIGVYVNCTNNTGLSYTNSNASSNIIIVNCTFALTTTGIAYYSMSSIGDMNMYRSDFENGGLSTTASSNSAGSVGFLQCSIAAPLATSSNDNPSLTTEGCNVYTAEVNATSITTTGTGVTLLSLTNFASGTASALSLGSSTNTIAQCNVGSANTNAITGGGTLYAGIITFTGVSSTINTSTVNKLTTYGGTIV